MEKRTNFDLILSRAVFSNLLDNSCLSQISLSFFDEKYRDILTLCGTKSGREINKMKEVPLTMQENFTFQEAKVTIQGEKIFETELDPSLIKNPEIQNQRYHGQENHMMYILEIKEILS